MSLMNIMLFENYTCSSYITISGNYNTYTNCICIKLYNAPESISTLKFLPLIVMSKQNSAASFPDVAHCCIYNVQVLSVMAGPVTSFFACWGSFGECAQYY